MIGSYGMAMESRGLASRWILQGGRVAQGGSVTNCAIQFNYLYMKASMEKKKKVCFLLSVKYRLCHSPHSLCSYEGYDGEECQYLHPGY